MLNPFYIDKVKYVMYIFLLIFPLSFVSAQTIFQPKQSDFQYKGFIYNNEVATDIKIHTNGMSVGVNFGKIETYYRTTFNHFSIGFIRDRREKKQNKNISLAFIPPSQSFVYGKQNSLILLRAGRGQKRYKSDKAKRNGIAVGYSFEYGPVLGLLKPYYLKLIYREEDPGNGYEILNEKYSDTNADKFLDFNAIYGGGGFFKGFNDLRFVPGLQGNASAVFALGAYDKYVKAVQVGVMLDLFIRKVPIMIESQNISNKPYFINVYVNLQLGGRTN